MKITIALVCAALSVAAALFFAFWINRKRGEGRETAKIYAVVKGRNSNFRSFQILPVSASAVIIALAAGFGLDWKQAAACAAGSACVLIPLIAGSFTLHNGITASFSSVIDGNIKQSLRVSYRTGAVLGSWITGICLAFMCLMVMVLKTKGAITYSASFALGSAIAAAVLHTGGEVYSSAYSLAVSPRDFTDRTGSFIAAGSDFAGSYIIAAVSSVLLAEVAVATSGVTSTFTAGSPLRFPLFVYGAGIIGTLAGVFLQRSGIGNDLSKGYDIGTSAAAIITAAISVYLSMNMMQTRVYAWPVLFGAAAGIIVALFSRFFSFDSKVFISSYKTDKSLGKNSSVVFNLGSGMMASAVYVLVIIASVAVSYMFASFYGVALCAVGICSVIGSTASVAGLVAVSGTTADILAARSKESDDIMRTVSDTLDSVSVRNLVSLRTFSSVAGVFSSFAALVAFFYISGSDVVDMMTLRVFVGIFAGSASAFLLAGMLISSVRITGRVALRDLGRNDDETGATSALRGAAIPVAVAVVLPALVGLFAGAKALAGFMIASEVTGYMIILVMNNSGMHYENTALQSLSSLLKMMAVFSVAFLPVFIRVGGFLFQ